MENVRTVSRRVDRLEDMMVELTRSVTQLSEDTRMTKEATHQANEAVRTLIFDMSRDLQTNITNLALEMRQVDLRAREADERTRLTVEHLSKEMREGAKQSRLADEALRQEINQLSKEMREDAKQSRLAIEQLSAEMREGAEQSRLADERARKANEALRQEIKQLSVEMREGAAESRLAEEALRQEMRKGAEQSRLSIEQLSKEMREGAEQSRLADEALGKKIEQLSVEMREGAEQSRLADEALRRELKKQRTHFNREAAKLSHKMGTLAEDMIAPSVPRILKEVVGCREEPQMESVRLRKRLPDGSSKEYDVLAVCEDYLLVCEVKSHLRPEDVRKFRDQLSEARRFLPEYGEKKIIGALGTFYVDPSLIKHGARMGLIMLGVTDGLMMVLNEEGFVPKAF